MNSLSPRKINLNTGEEVEISALHVEDYAAFENYRNIMASETTHTYQTPEVPLNKEKIISRWKDMKAGGTDFLFKATDSKNNLVGTFGLHINMRHHPWVAHLAIFGMGILKSHWGTGLAAKMMSIMEDIAKAEGITRLEAMVRVQNVRGVAFYKKMGFEIEGTRRKAALINGEYQDEFFIAKLL